VRNTDRGAGISRRVSSERTIRAAARMILMASGMYLLGASLQTAFDCINYAAADTSTKTVTFYAVQKPASVVVAIVI